MKNQILLVIVIVITVVILIYSINIHRYLAIANKEKINQVWTKENQSEYANLLLAKGLDRAAAEEMEKYLNSHVSPSDKTKLAKVCYELGNIYMGLYEYEKALKYFYRSEMLNKNPSFKDDLNEKIVEALERLGMSSQAEYELESRTSINEQDIQKNKNIIARIGKKEITEQEINEAIDKLPSWMKNKMQSKKERIDFIKQYVANEVLYEKAKKLGIGKSYRIRKLIEDFKKHIIVQEFIKEQLKKKLHIDPSDVKLYYEANKDKYVQKEKAKIRYIAVPRDSKEKQYIERLENGEGESVWIHKGDAYIENIGEAKEVIEKLLKKNKEETLGPVNIKGNQYVFIIEDKKSRRVKSFEEVKDEVNYEYKLNKQKKIIDSIVKEALESKDVEIYDEDANDK